MFTENVILHCSQEPNLGVHWPRVKQGEACAMELTGLLRTGGSQTIFIPAVGCGGPGVDWDKGAPTSTRLSLWVALTPKAWLSPLCLLTMMPKSAVTLRAGLK